MTARVTLDDLYAAREWLNAYEAEDGTGERNPEEGPYTGTDETAARMYRVADWLEAEIARREDDAKARRLIPLITAETGRTPTLEQARAAVRKARAKRTAEEATA